MADMIVEFRIMPEDGEVEYSLVENSAKELIENYDDSVQVRSVEADPVGFGLKAAKIEIQIDETCGTDDLEEKLSELENVGEVSITKMDRL